MASNVVEVASSESEDSIIKKGWGIISPNTEILGLMFFGVIVTVLEVLDYWPIMQLRDLFSEDNEDDEFESNFVKMLYKISDGVDTARYYTVHIYLAAYILLPYPLLTEQQNVMLTPWLLCSVLRSVLLNLFIALEGAVLCVYHAKMHFPCMRYSAVHAAELCLSLYMWTSVHAFYYFLNKKKTEGRDIGKVIKTIHKAGIRNFSEDSTNSSPILSIENLYDDDEEEGSGVEVTLVERAAMAWIAREILETGAEYISDSQFSQYLTIKATMELRQIIKELADRKRIPKTKPCIKKVRTGDTLEGAKESSTPELCLEAFEECSNLSRRDPIRRIPPLKPNIDTKVGPIETEEREVTATARASNTSTTVEVQTEPVSPGLARLFDDLELQQSAQEDAVSTKQTEGSKEDQ